MAKLIKTYWKTAIWCLCMCYLLFSPGSSLPKTNIFNFYNSDKLIHLGMFSVLTMVFLFDSRKTDKKKPLVIGFFLSVVLFSGLSEIIQHNFIIGRSGNMLDFTANIIGLSLGFFFYRLLLFFQDTPIGKKIGF